MLSSAPPSSSARVEGKHLMKFPIVLSAGLILAAGTAACSDHAASGRSPAAPVAVTTSQVTDADIATRFEAGGVVRARTVATVVSRVLADVRSIPVKPGDRVRAGQALVLLDARDLQAQHSRAHAGQTAVSHGATLADADRQAAEAGLALARVTHERFAQLRARNSVTQHELDQAVAGLRAAEARLRVADARLAESRAAIDSASAATTAARVALSYATLTAPFDGIVTEKLVDPGNMATPGLPLVTVEDTRAFRLEVRLDESRARFVRQGDEVDVRIDRGQPPPDSGGHAAPDALSGRVSEVSRMLDAGSHDFLVKVDLPGGDFRSGIFGRATFRGDVHRGLAVPESAVARRGQLAFVFVVDADARARLRLVNASEPLDGRIEIRAGLIAGERVVAAPPPALVDGSPVSATPGAGSGR